MEDTRYKGTIVQESLTDERIMNAFEITKYRVTEEDNPTDRWHLFTVLLDRSQIELVSHELKSEKWYAHFWSGDEIIAVFPDKVFNFLYSDKSTWSDAIAYGKTLGIPESQLDFLVEN